MKNNKIVFLFAIFCLLPLLSNCTKTNKQKKNFIINNYKNVNKINIENNNEYIVPEFLKNEDFTENLKDKEEQ